MHVILETIVVASGHVVEFLGVALSILLVAFSPLYLYAVCAWRQGWSIRSYKPARVYLFLALLMTMLFSALVVVTAVSLGAWG